MYVPLNSSFKNLDLNQCNWVNWFECRAISFLVFGATVPIGPGSPHLRGF